MLFTHAFVWPHFAYAIAMKARDPFRTEKRSLALDSALGGVWVVLMDFNPLPSVVIVTALSMDKTSVGGARFLARTLVGMVGAGAVTALVVGVETWMETTMFTVLACIPFMVTYPMAIGVVTYRLARRVREQNRQLAELSPTDGLSQLLNRRHWEDGVTVEYQRFRRTGRTGCLLMIDIDHFNAINDRYGHPVGDEVIRTVAGILRDNVRKADLAGRYGGEKFGILLPETSTAGAQVIAERIRQTVAGTPMETRHGVGCTVSLGVAALVRSTASCQGVDRKRRPRVVCREGCGARPG